MGFFESLVLQVLLLCSLLLIVQSKLRGAPIDVTNGESNDITQLNNAKNADQLRAALAKNTTKRWDKLVDEKGNFLVPYNIRGPYTQQEFDLIKDAMRAIQKNVCIRYFQATGAEVSFIQMENEIDEGCSSYVGRVPGKNSIQLEANDASTCVVFATIQHELLHSLGLWHEQMRTDRDKYIKVHYENIKKSQYDQFDQVGANNTDTFGIKYNYNSVMHYGKSAFANKPGAITMETYDHDFENIIGRASEAQETDYYKICRLYDCRRCMRKPFNKDSIPTTKSPKDFVTPPPYLGRHG